MTHEMTQANPCRAQLREIPSTMSIKPACVILQIAMFVFFPLEPLLNAQEAARLTLRVRDRVPVTTENEMPFQEPVKCDADGSIYAHPYAAPSPMSAPVVKISPEGKRTATFSITSVPEFEKSTIYDFAVGPRGEVYILSINAKGKQILSFESNGQYHDTIKLDGTFLPEQLSVSSSATFLVGGYKQKDNRATGSPFTGIFDQSGRLVKELELPGDLKPGEDTEERQKGAPLDPAISMSNVVAGDDGNFYLMRASAPPIVYVIAPDGSVAHRFKINPPGDGFAAGVMKAGGGKIVVEFYKAAKGQTPAEQLYSVEDATTGERFAYYGLPPEMPHGGALACYTPNGFTFIDANASRQLEFVTTTP
jgi:hypothetical protein